MMQVPLEAVATQTFTVSLGGQNTQINLNSRLGILYMDVYVDNIPIILGVQCQNGNRIVRNTYLGFLGDLIFVDTQGDSDPFFSGLDTRFLLEYLTVDDLNTLGLVG